MITLFIPTSLVLASQDAIPGDLTYPLKRQLENITIQLASLNPKTAAIFSADLSKRRFSEAAALLGRGKDASETLVELIVQTQQAAVVIDQVKDGETKKKLLADLSQKIENYNQNLTKIEESKKSEIVKQTTENPTPPPVIQPSASSAPITRPITTPVPTATADDSEKMLGLVKADVSQRTGISVSRVELISIKEANWSNSCLGKQQKGQACLTVIVGGFVIELQAKGKQFVYNTDRKSRFVLVAPEDTEPVATPTITPQPTISPVTQPTVPTPTPSPEPVITASPLITPPNVTTTINQIQTTIHELSKIQKALQKASARGDVSSPLDNHEQKGKKDKEVNTAPLKPNPPPKTQKTKDR